MPIKGRCMCGDISYEIDEPPKMAVTCHCSICRHAHGTDYGSFVAVSTRKFRWTSGEEKLRQFESAPGNFRQFCPRCGSQLTIIEGWNPKGITICMGSFVDDPGVRIGGHMYAPSKAPWHEISDDLPQYETWPPGMGPDAA